MKKITENQIDGVVKFLTRIATRNKAKLPVRLSEYAKMYGLPNSHLIGRALVNRGLITCGFTSNGKVKSSTVKVVEVSNITRNQMTQLIVELNKLGNKNVMNKAQKVVEINFGKVSVNAKLVLEIGGKGNVEEILKLLKTNL